MKPGTKVRVVKYGSQKKDFPVGVCGIVSPLPWEGSVPYIRVDLDQKDPACLALGEDDDTPWLFKADELEEIK